MPTDDNTTSTITLCFDDNKCFNVVKLTDSQSLLTNQTIFRFNEINYLPIDYAENVLVPDV